MKPFEIFRSGTHTSNEGAALTYGEADLAAIAAAYDPAHYQAPICVGHPKTDAPAYGWIDGLSVKGDRLVASPGDVDAEFADLVRAKRYKAISAAFFTPQAPNNPTPGKWHLRHVAFLGGASPAVKGLKPVEFAGGGEGVVTVEFADWQTAATADAASRLFRRLRDWIIGKDGLEQADAIIPEWDLQSLAEAADSAKASTAAYADPSTKKEDDMTVPDAADLARREAELVQREALLRAEQTTFADTKAKARADEDAAFVAGVVAEGRLPIGLQETATALFSQIGAGTMTFADGAEVEPRQAFRDLLKSLPVPVETREIAGGDGGDPVNFSDAAAVAAAITTEIKAAEAKGEAISHAEALARLHIKGATV